jgi:hypothetical protein
MPSSDDLLEQAAERCGFVLPTALAELVYNEMQGARRGVDNERTLHESIAREVLAFPAPSPAVDREALGREVRRVWIAWAREQPNRKLSWLTPWEELAEPDREVDRRIGETLGRRSVQAPDREALIALLNGLNGELSEEGMGDAFWRIEGNYQREGSGPGSPFEGMMLTTVQARWARSHLIEAAVDRLIAAGMVAQPPSDLAAFHQRALGLREAVEAMWSQRHKVMNSDGHTGGVLDGGAAAMDDLFHHPDTPESLRLPKLIAERGAS